MQSSIGVGMQCENQNIFSLLQYFIAFASYRLLQGWVVRLAWLSNDTAAVVPRAVCNAMSPFSPLQWQCEAAQGFGSSVEADYAYDKHLFTSTKKQKTEFRKKPCRPIDVALAAIHKKLAENPSHLSSLLYLFSASDFIGPQQITSIIKKWSWTATAMRIQYKQRWRSFSKASCVSQVDAQGLHSLTCKLAPGHIARHQLFNEDASRPFAAALSKFYHCSAGSFLYMHSWYYWRVVS